MNLEAAVKSFHHKMGHPIEPTPQEPEGSIVLSRECLIEEECDEAIRALRNGDLAAIAQELADLVYVAIGTAITYGIPFNRVFAEVHRANMLKTPGVPGEKTPKPEGWQPPNVAGVLGL